MSGPGDYVADCTEGVARVEDLPRATTRIGALRFQWIGKTLSKLFSSNLEEALTFLDDKLLPSTSNAVEHGNRRHRNIQKSVYRVRTKANTASRIALDMEREERTQPREQTTHTLHATRPQKAA